MANALDPILKPKTIAVIGASRSRYTIGHEILANLISRGFTGAVYPVNPHAHAIHSVRAYPSIGAVPEPVDLAIIVVPKQAVIPAAEECGQNGVKGLVVISAGFREVGAEGAERERELVKIIRRYGMRMIGPNCMGVLNANPEFSMNATFAPSWPPFGRLAFVSQSGAMGLSVLDYASEYGIGISQFVSMGNKPDVSGNDLLLQWEHDDTVDTILMYVENFGNPRNFLEIATRISKHKPIIVVKSGRSAVGAQAASSHTGALAASDTAVDALMHQAGVIRAGSVEEVFDIAMAFSGQPLPKSRRTAVMTNSGGPGILAADALVMNGLELPRLQPETLEQLRPHFPAEASIGNPLDMIASAKPSGYRAALDALLSDPNIDSAMAIFVPPLGIKQADVAEAIAEIGLIHKDKPVLGVLMGREGLPQGKAELHEVGIPAYIFPESAARALATLCRYREWKERPPLETPVYSVNAARARTILDRAVTAGLSKLSEIDTLDIFDAYGIPVAPARLASSAQQAAAIAEEFGYPVALKIVSPEIIHKTDVGGVVLGCDEAHEVREAFDQIVASVRASSPDATISGMLVQRMVKGGRETIVGVTRDASFGPMVMFGLGGVLVEAVQDVLFRIAPLSQNDARDMVRGLRGFKILTGIRGQAPAHLAALEEVLLRVSQLAVDNKEIRELDINPLLAFADGVTAVDGRVMIAIP
ncbi:MAG TPA: acetate--CoA ligase family protein [Gemmatimonadales bacterium]|nr:acetate--CoA ligase family protein [Gemmatimonadales bacterium]